MRLNQALNIGAKRSMLHLPTAIRGLNASAILAGAALLLIPAAFNGFPFVLDDTLGYLTLEPVIYRSLFYSLFVYATGLNVSPWLAAAAQCLIVSHLIWIWQRVICGSSRPGLFLINVMLLTGLSSAGLVAGYLVPDIFISVAILAIGLIALQREQLSRWEFAYLIVLTAIAVSVHLSHLPIAAAVVAAVVGIQWIQGEGMRRIFATAVIVIIPVAVAAGAILASNAILYGTVRLSPAGPVFLVANLIGKGPARDYLKEACPRAGYKICAILDDLDLPHGSNSFLWGGWLDRLGGFEAYRDEAGKIVAETIRTRPGAVARVAAMNILASVWTRAPGWDYRPLERNTAWFEKVLDSRYGPDAVAAWREGLQARGELPRPVFKAIDDAVLPLALLMVVAGSVFVWSRLGTGLIGFNALVLSGVAANVVVCAVGSGVFDRYQARVTWLIPFAAILLAARIAQSLAAAKTPLLPPRDTDIAKTEAA